MCTKPSLFRMTMTAIVVTAVTQPVVAQRGSTAQIVAGAMTAFSRTGPFGQLTALPFVLSSGDRTQLRAGATVWYSRMRTSFSRHRMRSLVGIGPTAEFSLGPPASRIQGFLRMDAQWLRSEVPDLLTTGEGPVPPITDRIGVEHGVGIGAEGAIGYALTESTGIRAGIGHTYQAIYPGRSGGFWKLGVGLVLGL